MNYAEWEKEINKFAESQKRIAEKVIFMLGFLR